MSSICDEDVARIVEIFDVERPVFGIDFGTNPPTIYINAFFAAQLRPNTDRECVRLWSRVLVHMETLASSLELLQQRVNTVRFSVQHALV